MTVVRDTSRMGSVLAVIMAAEALAPQVSRSQTPNENARVLQEVVVTGTLIRREEMQILSPLTVITSAEIANSGLTQVGDVLRSLSADNSGTIPTAFGSGFAAGSSGVALRGLTVNSTLVLVNGRRVADYALADDGERSFVDLNTLPLEAVDRIEVLRDGASSLYGADAIAGVVNIIMKASFQGSKIVAEAGTSQHGGGNMGRITATVGTGDLISDRFNAFISFEYQKDGRIIVGQRPFPFNTNNLSSIGGPNLIGGQPSQFSGSRYGSVTPGVLGTPGDITTGIANLGALAQPLRACGAGSTAVADSSGSYCTENRAVQQDDQPAEERSGVYAKLTFDLNSDLQAYIDASFFQNEVIVDRPLAQIQTGTPHNTNNIALPPALVDGRLNPNNPFAASGQYALINYEFGDIPSLLTEANHVIRFTAGFRGELAGWDYDSALVINHTSLETTAQGFLSYSALTSAINNGTYNFINPAANAQSVLSALAPTLGKVSTTDMDSLDLRLSRRLLNLPGGPLGLGLGAEARYEAQFDPNLNPHLDIEGLGVSQTAGHRTSYAAYAELDAPIAGIFAANVSGRYDHYKDFGRRFAPKVGLEFTPVNEAILRGTYSRGFRAPSFAENGSSSAEGFASYTPPASYAATHNNDGYVQQYSIAALTVANPKLKPETSDSFTFGAVVKPVKQLTVCADYYYIKKGNVIVQASAAPALAAHFAGQPLPPGYSITADAPDPAFPTALARPVVVQSPYINADSLSTDGIDLSLHFDFSLPASIRYTTDAELTKILSWKLVLPGGMSQQYVGTQGPYALSSGAGTPRYRGKWSNTVTKGSATVSLIMYYTSGFYMYAEDFAPRGVCLESDAGGKPFPPNCRTPGFIDFDLTGSYRVTDHFAAIGVIQNLLDRPPPFNPLNYAAINYDPAYSQSGIIGRYFRLGLTYTH
jgi:iron complex outermembrane receptor protein